VPGWGPADARLVVVGLAPGLRGANRTGRPFTGDHAGWLLYETLLRFGFAHGTYRAEPDDGLTLHDCRIVNAVRCVPPANLPTPREIATCNAFLAAELAALPNARVLLALGVVAHAAVLRAHRMPASRLRFAHGAVHELPGARLLADSFHVSRYNTSTRKLTPEMFRAVLAAIRDRLGEPDQAGVRASG
jgi:uracil-DNA glycosylase family 4